MCDLVPHVEKDGSNDSGDPSADGKDKNQEDGPAAAVEHGKWRKNDADDCPE